MKEPMKVIHKGTQDECKAHLIQLGYTKQVQANGYTELHNEKSEEAFVCENGEWVNKGTHHWPLREYILDGTFSAILFWG